MNRISLVCAVALALSAAAAKATITVGSWVAIFQGVEFATGEADTNEVRLQKVRAVRVDLSNPAVEFFSTPAGGPLETLGQTTTTFVNTYSVAVAINANFFSPVSTTPNEPRDLSGLAISQGNIVSTFSSGRPAVLITRSNQVSFITSAPANYNNVWTAAAGSDRVLINGVAQLATCTTDFCNENPRSAVGLSSNGRYLYLMVIDGRQPGWSDGATLYETGQWLARFGAWNGLNLDGGGSTAMAKLESGAAVLLNRPSGGVQRVDGNHLGVFAPAIAPVIVTQPQNQTAPLGSNATFTVFAGGTTPLGYQWRFNGTNLAGATGTNLTLTNLVAGNGGNYTVAITNSAGTTISSNALLTVTVPFDLANLVVQPRPSSALIAWTSNPQATSQIEYGVAPDYGNVSPLEPVSLTNHTVLLVGLVPNTNHVFRIHSHLGTNEVVSSQFAFSTDVSVIVDNPQASYSGNWTLGTSSPDKYGAYYQYATTTTDASPTAQASYTPNIITPGQYDVSIWYPQGSNRSTNAPVAVFFNGGAISKTVNQTTGGGGWRLLAPALDFAAGAAGFAIIGNNTSDAGVIVTADALRWSYSTAQDNPADGTVPEWWSNYYFGGPVDAALDPDGDGYSTYAEYILGTQPTDGSSRLRVTSQRTAGGFQLSFSPWAGGRIYELQSRTNLDHGPWLASPAVPTVANGQGVFSITNSAGPGSGYYRLAVRLAP